MRGGRSKLKAPGRDRDGRRGVGAARRRSARGHEAFGTTRARELLTGKLARNFKRRGRARGEALDRSSRIKNLLWKQLQPPLLLSSVAFAMAKDNTGCFRNLAGA